MVERNENKGFSLVELIVVVAIMAVLVAVLAPALLAYVERTRAQKDDSAMGEVGNAIQVALADEKIYDEALMYRISKNFSCYTDAEHFAAENVVVDKTDATNGNWWHLNDNARIADESAYSAAGVMRGLTITFQPVKDATTGAYQFVLADAKVNDMAVGGSAADFSERGLSGDALTKMQTTLGEMTAGQDHHYLYNRVRSNIGDTINLTSQTYRSSPYTVFIRLGSQGGRDEAKQDSISVYGQWGGTNLETLEAGGSYTTKEAAQCGVNAPGAGGAGGGEPANP